HVRAEIIGRPLEGGAGLFVYGPSLRALLPSRGRPVQHFALAAVEAQHFMGASPVLPHQTVCTDGDASRAGQWHLVGRRYVDFRLACLRRIQPAFEAHERRVALADSRAPQAPIDWVDGLRVTSELDPVVLIVIDRLVR